MNNIKKILISLFSVALFAGAGILVGNIGTAQAQTCWGETCNRYYYPSNGWFAGSPTNRICSSDAYTFCNADTCWWPDYYTSWRTSITDGSYVSRLRFYIPWNEINPTEAVGYGYYNTSSSYFTYVGGINHYTAYGYTFPVCENGLACPCCEGCDSTIDVNWYNSYDRGIVTDDCGYAGSGTRRIYSDSMQVCNY